VYDPLEKDERFDREYVVHGEDEYADDAIHVNTCEIHASLARRWLSPNRGISKHCRTQYFRAYQSDENFTANPDEKHSNTPKVTL
jgi:transposase-like protein